MISKQLRRSLLLAALLLVSGLARAAEDTDGGWVTLGDLRFEVDRVLALRAAGDHPEDPGNVEVYLSTVTLDVAALRDSGYPEGAASAAVEAAGGALVVLCITPRGEGCGVMLQHTEPPVHERIGPHGELQLEANDVERIAGRWSVSGLDLFGTPLAFELRFDAPVHPLH